VNSSLHAACLIFPRTELFEGSVLINVGFKLPRRGSIAYWLVAEWLNEDQA